MINVVDDEAAFSKVKPQIPPAALTARREGLALDFCGAYIKAEFGLLALDEVFVKKILQYLSDVIIGQMNICS